MPMVAGVIHRRKFLGMAAAGGASAVLHGCADAGSGAGGTDGDTETGGTTGRRSASTASSSPSSTDPDGTGTATTMDDTASDASESSESDTDPPGECVVEGEMIEFDPESIASLESGSMPLAVLAGEM